jgi:hypothetical protein
MEISLKQIKNPGFIEAMDMAAGLDSRDTRNKLYSEFLKGSFIVPVTPAKSKGKSCIIIAKKDDGETGIFAFTDMENAGKWTKSGPKIKSGLTVIDGRKLVQTAYQAGITAIVANPAGPSYRVISRAEMQFMLEGAAITGGEKPVLEVESNVQTVIKPPAKKPEAALKSMIMAAAKNNYEVEAVYFFDIAFGMGELHPAAGIVFRPNMTLKKSEAIMTGLMTKAQTLLGRGEYFDFMDITVSRWRRQVEDDIKPELKK